ncbi:DNA transformation protein [Bacilli bacterium PM5-3]|nr:DNA transformation protein [Bacilli bacterium PM5-3]
MEDLKKLINIGPEIARQLNEVGIKSEKQLKEVGSKKAWLKIQEIDESACYNRLLGLEGAIQNVKKVFLSDEVKTDLKDFYNNHKK